MRTEDQFYFDHIDQCISLVADRIHYLEGLTMMSDQDEMELNALDRLLRDLEAL